jgi:hypothetical protein
MMPYTYIEIEMNNFRGPNSKKIKLLNLVYSKICLYGEKYSYANDNLASLETNWDYLRVKKTKEKKVMQI